MITGAFPPARTAEADHILHLCCHLAETGLEIDVLTSLEAAPATDLPFRLHPVMREWGWSDLPRFARVVKRCAPDVALIWYIGTIYHGHPMTSFAPTILKRVVPGVRVVTQITFPIGARPSEHSLVVRAGRKAASYLAGSEGADYEFGTLLRDSDRVIAMSVPHLEALSRTYPACPSKSLLIPAPPLLPMTTAGDGSRRRGRRALGVGSDDFLFAYFGRLYAGKGLENLLRAFARVCGRHPNARLAIVGGVHRDGASGSWSISSVHELAASLGITDRVVWTGEYRWDSDEASTYLWAADAAVLPFRSGVHLNNSSLAGVAAHELPLITTRGEELESPFRDGENVLLCPPEDPESLAVAMEQVLIDSDLRRRLAAGMATLAREWLSWRASVARTVAALNPVAPTEFDSPGITTRFAGAAVPGGRA